MKYAPDPNDQRVQSRFIVGSYNTMVSIRIIIGAASLSKHVGGLPGAHQTPLRRREASRGRAVPPDGHKPLLNKVRV